MARHRARRRLADGADRALAIRLLFGIEPELARPDESSALALDEGQLAAMGGAAEGNVAGASLLLGVQGRVYDVAAGERFYARGRAYHAFTGRDASALLCTGCVTMRCLIRSVRRASAALALGGARAARASSTCAREAQRWLEFFESHDKYPFVGVVPAQRALARALSPVAAEPDADADGAAARTAAAFVRLGVHALLGPRVPTRSRELLVELSLSLDERVGVHDAPVHVAVAAGSSAQLVMPVDAVVTPEREMEARDDLRDALIDAEAGADDDEMAGVRAVAHLLELADAERAADAAASGVQSEGPITRAERARRLAARLGRVGAEFERSGRGHQNRRFRPR